MFSNTMQTLQILHFIFLIHYFSENQILYFLSHHIYRIDGVHLLTFNILHTKQLISLQNMLQAIHYIQLPQPATT